MSQEFAIELQQIVESDFVCTDGVCFVPPSGVSIAQADTRAEQSRD